MAKAEVYTITINSFLKHNPKSKKSFSYFMLSTSFFNDDKIARCTPGMLALYVYFLSVCADYVSGTIKVTANSVPTNLKVGLRFAEVLVRLEQLQLLTIEKNDVLNNRIEEKRIEEKRIEVVKRSDKKTNPQNRAVWEAYKKAYQERYREEPIRNDKTNSIVYQLVKRVGAEEAILLVQFFVNHNKQYYIQRMHDLGACLHDCEGLVIQRRQGRAILDKDIREFSQQEANIALLEASRKGGF